MSKSKDIVGIVRRNLWARGYAVKTVAGMGLGFDLFVENAHKVCVYPQKVKVPDSVIDSGFIAALVSFDAAGRPVIMYEWGIESEAPTISPQKVFGLPANNSSKDYGKGKKEKGGK